MEGSFILKEIHTLGPNIVTAGDWEFRTNHDIYDFSKRSI